ncbi:hypothetical protein KVV02_002027 [Mortierella alpina]|uniref:Uncharacterized protein n=1 Tax=Mortierella alpina TaxID=64518 RepID=A0A9P8A6D9_MORAP|nr:hypothetical protein KVV02_002027 [Mortierella alpina]
MEIDYARCRSLYHRCCRSNNRSVAQSRHYRQSRLARQRNTVASTWRTLLYPRSIPCGPRLLRISGIRRLLVFSHPRHGRLMCSPRPALSLYNIKHHVFTSSTRRKAVSSAMLGSLESAILQANEILHPPPLTLLCAKSLASTYPPHGSLSD